MTLTPEIADKLNMSMTDDLYWSDSSWFSWAIPEKNINGFFYNHFRPNMNCMLGGPAMWDNSMPNISGQNVWNFLYYDWQLMRELPKGKYGVDYNKYDFETPWSMSIRTLEPMQKFKLAYDRDDLKLDLVFTATSEPNVIGQVTESAKAFKLHFEQPGKIQGTVKLGETCYEVDCFSIRDGSNGPRFLEKVVPGGYTWSAADDKNGWHLLAKDKNNSRDTEVVGGYIFRNGIISSVTKGTRRILQREGPRPQKIEVLLEDELGRELHAIGCAKVPAEFMLFPDRGQWWSQFSWEYDGFSNAVGEDQEYYGIYDFRRWHRAGSDAWAKR